MSTGLNIVITIGARDAQRDAYAVQLQHEGNILANIWAQLNRQALLEDEHNYSAHDYGMELYDALFTGAVRDAYQRLIGQAGAETAIRVQLVIHPDAPELHALPWERLFHVFDQGEIPLAASARTPFSRFLVSGVGDQPPVQELPLRLLVAIANPTGLPDGCSPLDVAGEAASLAALLAGFSGVIQGTLLAGRSGSGLPADLRRRLTGQGWTLRDGVTSWQTIQRCLPGHHVLHVLAHGQFKPGELPGNGTAYLLLEHEGTERIARGAVDRVSDDEIIAGLAGVHPLPQLIFLAACDSARRPPAAAAATGANPFVGLAPKLVSRGVPAIVAMQDLVPMNLARTLTTDFYRNQFAWAIPVLFLRLKHGQLFSKPVAPRQPFEPEMVLIPAGEFKMGSDPGPGIPKHETPQHTVTLSAYYIGKYPVTNAQYAEFIKTLKLSDLGEAHARKPEGWLNLEPPADRLAHPVTGVSWRDAVAYCRWLGEQTDRHYRLPTEAEWEKAARGAAGRRYPWGDAWDPACANVGKDTTAVTDHPSGASPYGCQDLLGNVLQWTSTVWGTQPQQPDYPYPYRSDDGREVANPRALPAQARLVCRGGPYPFRGEALRCTARSNMTPDSTSSRTAWRGFRVAMDIR